MATRMQAIGWTGAAAVGVTMAAGMILRPDEPPAGRSEAPLTIMGRHSEIREQSDRLAQSQEVFDALWLEHMGARAETAAQGWPLTPQVDWEAYCVLMIFGGDSFNANGYRVMEIIEEADALTVRVERASYQTMARMGEVDHGDAVTPWAMLLLPATERTIFLEENVQGLIGKPPVWKQRAVFPGRIGVGRVVPGTRQQ